MITKNKLRNLVSALAVTLCISSPLQAEVALDASAKDLPKTEVTHSMIGVRDTLRFYIFEEEKAVLVVRIDNKDTTFSVSAKLYAFAKETTAEGLSKWVNNQHSDGLYPEFPEPEAVHEIPAASSTVKNQEVVGQVEESFGKFTRYSVTFEIKDVPAMGDLGLKDFTDKATVYVKGEGI